MTLSLESLEKRQDSIIRNAEYFTVYEFKGRGNKLKTRHDTIQEAIKEAQDRPRALVYAVHSQAIDALVPRELFDHYLNQPTE